MGLMDNLLKLITGRTIRACNTNPVLSLVFDVTGRGLPDSAILAELERVGSGATLAVDAGLFKNRDDEKQAERLFHRGHEFAVRSEGVAANAKALYRAIPDVYISTVLASGSSSLTAARDFAAVVSRRRGFNVGVLNLGHLHSESFTRAREAQIGEVLDRAVITRGWVILVIPAGSTDEHQVDATSIHAICEEAQAQNFEILTVRNGLGAIGWDRDWRPERDS